MRQIDIYLKASTKKGQFIISRGEQYIGTNLRDVYGSWSHEKQWAYDKCYEMYLVMENHNAFSICSRNTWCFTCSWVATLNGENVLIYCTDRHTYCVYLDR